MSNLIPRSEYPRMQMRRADWLCLNGQWQFEIDAADSGMERGLLERELTGEITVPFCPESRLSGVEHKDFMAAVWYRRVITLPESWLGGRVLLHFGAVDYSCDVYVNGALAGSHRGGYTSFEIEITDKLTSGENVLVVHARDDLRRGMQPGGKQSTRFVSYGCSYTRTTGIWQSVWMELLPATALRSVRYEPDLDNGCVYVQAAVDGDTSDLTMRVETTYEGCATGETTVRACALTRACVRLGEKQLWEPGCGRLYDTRVTLLRGGETVDTVEGYFGLRKLELKPDGLYVNDKPTFMRTVLDQGFYPDGVYTAPTDDDLRRDVELSMAVGFNGARLHEKVFEERFLYWADKLGYMVWGEFPNWCADISNPAVLGPYQDEWLESVERDISHPALIGWCPFNETWDVHQNRDIVRSVYLATKHADPSRPVIDTSGGYHYVTDIYDVHDYEQRPDVFAAHYAGRVDGSETYDPFPKLQKFGGEPYFVSEYGGIWAPVDGVWVHENDGEKSWGYGKNPASEQEYAERYAALTAVLLDNPGICGLCYTQLYDIEQEQNGIYGYDRAAKFAPETMKKLREAMVRPAAMEKK